MIILETFFLGWFLLNFEQANGISFNQPKLCPNASWNPSAITFASTDMVGTLPWAVFVNRNNTVYAANRENGFVLVWLEGSSTPIRNISSDLNSPYSLFVSDSDEIYVDNGEINFRVDKWSMNSTNATPVMYVCDACYGLFIDINNNFYCSMSNMHRVISQSLNDRLSVSSVVAGTGVQGSDSRKLSYPYGILVDKNLNLYIADFLNDRIQMFAFGKLNGTTVVGTGAPGTYSLRMPFGVIMDADGYLFISDGGNHRIIGSGPDGYRCIAACSGTSGSSSTQLDDVSAISFDTYGNLYVVDYQNGRIQKFLLLDNSCGTTITTTSIAMTTSMNTSSITTAPANTTYSIVISYNQPKFSASATWSSTGVTFANNSTVGAAPRGLFIDTNNTVYVANQATNRVQIWLEGTSTPTRNITGSLVGPHGIFVTNNGDIYVDNGLVFNRVDKWMVNGTRINSVMYVKNRCDGLFVDINNNLYCSLFTDHQVMMKSLNSNSDMWILAAGTGCLGSTANRLNNPAGIFVDKDLNLFVADYSNDRIQKFLSQQLDAMTVAGNGALGTIDLFGPSGIVLDDDGYLFIVDSDHHRIVASGPNGFRCILGCSMVMGSSSNQLNYPWDLKFDSYGNLFVTDKDNNRVQKFLLISNMTYPLAINQPNLCPSTTWYPDGITFANSSTIGAQPYSLFIDFNNTLYATNRQANLIQIWFEGNVNPSRTLPAGLNSSYSMFVTRSGDVYVDNSNINNRIDQWSMNTNSSVPVIVMIVPRVCYGLFVDSSNTLYCSVRFEHQVVKKWLGDNRTEFAVVAGIGYSGSASNEFSYPEGLFVDVQFSLYVTDSSNHRIQMFPLGQMDGITIAGSGAPGTIVLYYPHAITFDANGYLFISDTGNNRIVGSGPYGFRCIVGCTGTYGSGLRELNYPYQFAFDTYGNLYVTDRYNSRIQKFILASNSCGLSYNQPKLCSDAMWFANASTFASSSVIGSLPTAIFIDGINNVYAPNRVSNTLLAWTQLGTSFRNITGSFNHSFSVFVSINGDVYFDNGFANGRVRKCLVNTSTIVNVMNVNGSCYGLFIDWNNYLYCSLKDLHQVVKLLLNNGTTMPSLAAGTGSPGAASNMLNNQQGIYVDNYLNLYIADCGNDRIQLYQSGQSNGVTVAGTGASGTIPLSCPTGVVLDSDGFLFIVDGNNHRIVGSSLYGFRCLIGCSGSGGASLTQLLSPQSMAFDSYGNIYVTDRNNSRIQMFGLQKTNCSTPTTIQTTVGPTTTAAQTTAPLTTSVAETTASPFTSTIRATAASTISIETTTLPTQFIIGTTTAAHTTDETMTAPTTSIVQTMISSTINAATPMTSTLQTTSTSVTTVAQTTSSVEISTVLMVTTELELDDFTSAEQFSTPLTTAVPITTTKQLNQSCYPPMINLIPGQSNLTSSLQYRRSEDISISSIIQLNCDLSLSTITQWTMKKCHSKSCSLTIHFNTTIITTLSELFLPSKTLDYGTYELTLTVTMMRVLTMQSSSTIYIQIIPTDIIVNLLPMVTSMITHSSEEDLRLDPGTFSIDPDQDRFDASKWTYEYYCRLYDALVSINESSISSCLSNRSGNLIYDNSSSVIIVGGSLQPNRIYQFMVHIENRQNPSIKANGYVLVTTTLAHSPMIAIGCVIAAMCIANEEFEQVNPTTQMALFSVCMESCLDVQTIEWSIYQGQRNSSTSIIQWSLFSQAAVYDNLWIFGRQTSNFTVLNQIFLQHSQITYWRFEVIYTFTKSTSRSALNVVINQPPTNGSCSIHPSNGTITTLFTISCSNWFDDNQIKDYSLHGIWSKNTSEQMIIAFSVEPTFTVRLPAGDVEDARVHLVIHIRDKHDCIREVNLSSVIVSIDWNEMNSFIENFNISSDGMNKHPFIQLLSSGNQNIVGQMLISLSQQFNRMNDENIKRAISNGISPTIISISSLGNEYFNEGNDRPINESAWTAYTKELNSQANIRDYLINFLLDLPMTDVNRIQLQSSVLVQMTQATNQLTRTATIIAAERCHQLASALSSLAKQISFEDVQTSATQLMQCGSNVLTAINGPLQNRMIPLDLDLARADIEPSDYDTNLESPWAKINSLSTIDRNLYYQNEAADLIFARVNEIDSLITSALNIHLNLGQQFLINTSQIFFNLEILSIESLRNKIIEQRENARFEIPWNFTLNTTTNSSILLRSIMRPLAMFENEPIQSDTNLSRLISLSILDRDGRDLSLKTNSMRLIIPHDPQVFIPSMNLQNVSSINFTNPNSLFYLHYINITSVLPISVHMEMHPLNETLAYLMIYQFDQIPQLNSLNGWRLFCPSDLINGSIYSYFLDNHQTVDHESLIFGLRELNSNESLSYCSNMSQLPNIDQPFHFTSDYELRLYTSACYYFTLHRKYQSDGLTVGPSTNHYQTECFTNHLTSFAGGFLVLPSPINWNYVFTHADFMRNKTIYLTVIIITLIYVILMIYARWKDRQDLVKLGITLLADNQRDDHYFYQMIIFTGQRMNAGTESNVYLLLSGDQDQTPARRLNDPQRKVFQRGGVDSFILAVPKSLGLLNYLRIWHDNSGQGSSASWFLKYIIVRDLQTMEKNYFIAQRWLAVEEDDGLIERLLPVANEMERYEFSYLLSKRTYHSVSDGHLWFSIFSRPPSNRFTRVQRCTCCFVLLFSSMLFNIMYYDQTIQLKSSNQVKGNSLAIGPLYISAQQIGIGIMMELFSLIPSLFIVQFFRRLESRHPISPLRQALLKINPLIQISPNTSAKKKRNLWSLTFPWWCIFFVYILSYLIIALSIFFIIVRGIEFGDLKSQQWLTSILTGIFSSILLTQPMKVMGLVIFFACFCRNWKDVGEESELLDDEQIELMDDETPQGPSHIYRSSRAIDRLNEGELSYAREQRLKEIDMWSIIKEFLFYAIFFVLICVITLSHREVHQFYQVKHLRHYLLNTYANISTVDEYWQWLEGSFVGNLRAQSWYNGNKPRYLNGYLNDKSSRLIGWASMRQLRVKSESCANQRVMISCENDYSYFNEDRQSYSPGWTNETNLHLYSSSILRSFQYQSNEYLDTYLSIGEHGIYSGNGYVYEYRGALKDLRQNLSELHRLGWIDQQTRAIVIQMTLYNPNVQLFTSVTLLSEFLSSGGVFTSARIEPLDFYVFSSLLQLISTLLYMILILYMMIQQMRAFVRLKWKYFRQFWSLIDLGIIGCSWGSVGVYIWRFQESNRIGEIFSQTNGYVYINIQQAVYLNDLLTYLQGFCGFFALIKFARLCRISSRLSLFIQTLSNAREELVSFAGMFAIIFMSFISLFYLLFVSKIWSCSNLLSTAQMLFEVTLSKFDASELLDADAFLGPACFTIFIFVVVFVCLSVFLSIISENFRRAREQRREEEEMLSFIWRKFLRWTGLKPPSGTEILEQRDIPMRAQYVHPAENLPNRIDQLLTMLNRIYMDQRIELSRLDRYRI